MFSVFHWLLFSQTSFIPAWITTVSGVHIFRFSSMYCYNCFNVVPGNDACLAFPVFKALQHFWILLRILYCSLQVCTYMIFFIVSTSLPISVLLFLKVNSSNWLGDVKFIRFGFVTLGLILAFSIIKKLPLKLPSFNLTNSLKTCFCCYISMTSFCFYWFNGKSTW